MKLPLKSALSLVIVGLGFASPAMAASLSAFEVLQQFNLVVVGDSTSYSHVDGRTYIGGELAGGDYVQHPGSTPASAYAGLTVRGNASSLNLNGLGAVVGGNLSNANINSGFGVVAGNAAAVNFNGGPAYVGGTASATNFNGGRAGSPAADPALQGAYDMLGATDFASVMSAFSQQLSHLGSTGSSVAINGNRATFNAVADAGGLAVFDLTGFDAQLFSLGEFEFNLNGAQTVVFNSDELSYDIGANFLAGSAASIAPHVVWNLYGAGDIRLRSQFGGVVLAPNARLTNWNNIEGTVVVDSLNQYGEIHQQGFLGTPPRLDVPEPGSLALTLLGLAGFAAARRRRSAGAF